MLLIAQMAGVRKLGRISLDGTKLHADASKSQAIRYQRLLEVEGQLNQEVSEWLALAERTDQGEFLSEELRLEDAIYRCQDRLAHLAEAKIAQRKPHSRCRRENGNTTTAMRPLANTRLLVKAGRRTG